jgi:hypothetical protein
MDGYWETKLIMGLGALLVGMLIYVLRDRITGITISRTGLQMHLNDVVVWRQIEDTIDQIDSSTCRSVRKATTGLMIIDPGKYSMPAEVMLGIWEANMPLIWAGYENHCTRLIFADGGEMYIAEKNYDIQEVARRWQKRFPELTDEVIANHVRRWVKKVLVPNLRKACLEKVTYYKQQIAQHNISKTIKEDLTRCLHKNVNYIECFDKLISGLGSDGRTNILYKEQTV